jgi:hypothetical protein
MLSTLQPSLLGDSVTIFAYCGWIEVGAAVAMAGGRVQICGLSITACQMCYSFPVLNYFARTSDCRHLNTHLLEA